MPDFHQEDLAGSRFEQVHLQRATFQQVHLNDAEFTDVDLTGARFHEVFFKDVVMRSTGLVNVRIDGDIREPRHQRGRRRPAGPGRAGAPRPRPSQDAADRPGRVPDAWATLERLWAGTVERARRLPAGALHESVDGEWSFVETLRHLAFATECWLHRAILGDPRPWHPLSLPWDQMPDTEGCRATVRPGRRSTRPSRCGSTGRRPSAATSTR